ncbi:MAG: hypothetical protein M1821_005988 [Bathelium mastoideum]|nr:MAG: hypothetical protein M1821_005988 [Bathelium mastoideum]
MGISNDSLFAIQPNPLKRMAIALHEQAMKPVAGAAETICDAQTEKTTSDFGEAEYEEPVKKPKKRKKATDGEKEVRSRVFYVIERTRTGTEDCPEEMVDLAGSTGNIYTVHIKKQPTCTCPAYQRTVKPGADIGDECKHILWVTFRVLKAPPHLQYQLAFLSSELREIFTLAPPIPTASPSNSPSDANASHRKPIEDDCPVCCCPFDADDADDTNARTASPSDDIVWCRASCGNNVHRACFEQWAATKKAAGYGSAAQVTCPFCRAPWQGDEQSLQRIAKGGERNEEGYVNVAEQLGISTERDYSSYHQPWVRTQQKAGKLPRYY